MGAVPEKKSWKPTKEQPRKVREFVFDREPKMESNAYHKRESF